MAKIFEFNATNTTLSAGVLTNVLGNDWNVVRNSPATYFNGSTLYDALSNVPRIQGGKVLIEAEDDNFIIDDTEALSDWVPFNGTKTTPQNDSPRGAEQGLKYTLDTTTSVHSLLGVAADGVLNDEYYFSAFVKTEGAQFIQISFGDGFFASHANFDIINGTVTDQSAGIMTAGVEDVGNGWFRIWAHRAMTNNTTLRYYLVAITSGTSVRRESFLGDGSDQWTVFGACISNSLSSYIVGNFDGVSKTTREADVITNTVPSGGIAPLNLTKIVNGVESSETVTAGQALTMENGTESIIINDSSSTGRNRKADLILLKKIRR